MRLRRDVLKQEQKIFFLHFFEEKKNNKTIRNRVFCNVFWKKYSALAHDQTAHKSC